MPTGATKAAGDALQSQLDTYLNTGEQNCGCR
jgi:hypothetical protein